MNNSSNSRAFPVNGLRILPGTQSARKIAEDRARKLARAAKRAARSAGISGYSAAQVTP